MESNGAGSDKGLKWGLGFAIVALCIVTGVSLAYLSRGRAQVNDLTSANQALNSSVALLKAQLESVNRQLESVNQRLKEQRATPAAQSVRAVARNGALTRSGAPEFEPRFNRIQNRLDQQEKSINSTREDLDKTREDLQGKLDSTRDDLSNSLTSTRDELSGSIARTHDELVALQKRGERNYYEFRLSKSKQFQRRGSRESFAAQGQHETQEL